MTLIVQTPDKLSSKAKELLKQYDAETGDSLHAAEKFKAGHNGGDDGAKKTKRKKFF